MERRLHNQGINNFLAFWSTKIRENLTNFFSDQNLLILLDEIDQKVTKVESKKESIEKEKQKEREKARQINSSKIKERTSYHYRPIIIKDREIKPNNRNIIFKYKINERISHKNNRYER